MFIKEKNIIGYFGCKDDNLQCSNGVYETNRFKILAEKINIQKVVFLKQTHSKDVFFLDKIPEKSMSLFEIEGDAIITNQKNIGIGVVTADCVPLFLIDSKNDAIGVVHAGWKGLSLKIITATIDKMQTVFGTELTDLKIYLGPSADVCCYEVQPDFLAHFDSSIYNEKIVEKRNEKIFFHPKRAALVEIEKKGVALSKIDVSHHHCTICHENFCSVRREKESAGRQPSIIYIKD